MLYMYMYGVPLMCKIIVLYMAFKCIVDSNDVNYSYCTAQVANLIF